MQLLEPIFFLVFFLGADELRVLSLLDGLDFLVFAGDGVVEGGYFLVAAFEEVLELFSLLSDHVLLIFDPGHTFYR